jgi:hypothetical protein
MPRRPIPPPTAISFTRPFSGHLNGVTGVITATVTYTGGTGRFAHASGTATLAAQLLPDGSIEVAVQGTIDY